MNRKTERTLAGLAVGVLLFVWFGIFLLMWYVPRVIAGWERAGRDLPTGLRLLAPLARLVGQTFLFTAPLLLAVTVAAAVWRFQAIRRVRREAAAS